MFCCKLIVEGYDSSYDSDVVVMTLLDYSVKIVCVPDIAYFPCCLNVRHVGEAVFILKIYYYGIELTVVAEFNGLVYCGTGTDVERLDFDMFRCLYIFFGKFGKRSEIIFDQIGCLKLLGMVNDRLRKCHLRGNDGGNDGSASRCLGGLHVSDYP